MNTLTRVEVPLVEENEIFSEVSMNLSWNQEFLISQQKIYQEYYLSPKGKLRIIQHQKNYHHYEEEEEVYEILSLK